MIIGVFCGAAFLLLLGPDSFIMPALVMSLILLLAFRKRIEAEKEAGS